MPSFSYTLNIPNAPNNPSNDQGPMQTNNNSISSLILVDHFGFNDNQGGLHKQVQMPLSNGAPGTIPAGLTGNEGTLYTKTGSAESQLFYTPDASSKEYQLTRTSTADFPTFAQNIAYGTPPAGFTQVGGWTFLPGGMLYQYGFYSRTGNLGTSGQIQFPKSFTTFVSSIVLTLYRNSGNQQIALNSTIVPTLTTFNFLTSSSGSDGVFWYAIGV